MKVLDNIPVFKSSYQNYLEASQAVLHYYEEKADIKELRQLTGNEGIFEFYFSETWHDEACIYSRIEDILSLICEHYGFESEWFMNKNFEETLEKIMTSIDAERPVITQSLGSETTQFRGEWMIICGYSDEGDEPIAILNGSREQFISTPYPQRANGAIGWGDHFPFHSLSPDFYADMPLFVIKNKKRKNLVFNKKKVATNNLERIVRFSENTFLGGKYKLWGGVKGMEKWRWILHEMSDTYAEKQIKNPARYFVLFNARMPNALVQARKKASFYLFQISNLFSKEVMQKLWKAGELYSKVSEEAYNFLDLIYCDESTWKDEKFEEEIRLGTERLRNRNYRKRGSEILNQMIQNEKAAIHQVREALALLQKR